jgi:PKD repeat protein
VLAAGSPIAFDGSGSSDPDGEITSWSWSFGDGGEASGTSPSHVYAAPGSYKVSLTVFDSSGLGAKTTRTIVVEPAGTGGGNGQLVVGGPFGGGGIAPPAVLTPPAPTGTLALVGSTLRVRSGHTLARLSCAGTAPRCSGQLVLSVRRRVRVHGRLRTQTVRLATGTFSFVPGAPDSVTLKLTPAGRTRLRSAHGRLTALLQILRTSPAPQQVQTLTVTLRGR